MNGWTLGDLYALPPDEYSELIDWIVETTRTP
jgi:hypothetical protein